MTWVFYNEAQDRCLQEIQALDGLNAELV